MRTSTIRLRPFGRAAERVERLVGADQRLVDVGAVLSGHGLGREWKTAAAEELQARLAATRLVPQPAAVLDELAAAPDGERRDDVNRHQSHPGDGDRRISRNRGDVGADRIGVERSSGAVGALVRRMAGGDDHVVDDNRRPVGQAHLFAPIAPADQIDRGRGVMDDVDPLWCAGDQRAVEPLEVLAH